MLEHQWGDEPRFRAAPSEPSSSQWAGRRHQLCTGAAARKQATGFVGRAGNAARSSRLLQSPWRSDCSTEKPHRNHREAAKKPQRNPKGAAKEPQKPQRNQRSHKETPKEPQKPKKPQRDPSTPSSASTPGPPNAAPIHPVLTAGNQWEEPELGQLFLIQWVETKAAS